MKNKICFCFLFGTDGCFFFGGGAPGSGRSSVFTPSPPDPLHMAVLSSPRKPSLHVVWAKQKSPHTYSPKFRLFTFQLRIHTRAWLCVQTHTQSSVRHVQGAGQLCWHHDCVHISASPSSSVGSPWVLPSPTGFLQQQSKTPRECFSASIKTCWDSLTLSPPSGIFPQENIKCVWLSRAFPELCEGLGSHPGGALLPVPLWPSLMYSSETGWRIQRMTAGRPPSPPHTIYFLYRMSVSSELNGSYVTREKNKRAM